MKQQNILDCHGGLCGDGVNESLFGGNGGKKR